jgi:hypothetical protein
MVPWTSGAPVRIELLLLAVAALALARQGGSQRVARPERCLRQRPTGQRGDGGPYICSNRSRASPGGCAAGSRRGVTRGHRVRLALASPANRLEPAVAIPDRPAARAGAWTSPCGA